VQVTGIQASGDTELSSLRVDSMGLVLLAQKLSNALKVQVQGKDFYRFDTVNQLATEIYHR